MEWALRKHLPSGAFTNVSKTRSKVMVRYAAKALRQLNVGFDLRLSAPECKAGRFGQRVLGARRQKICDDQQT